MYICGANSFSKLFLSFWVACAECAFFSLLLSIYFECNFLVVGLCFFLFWIYCSQTVVFVGGATYTVVFSILNEVCLAFKTVQMFTWWLFMLHFKRELFSHFSLLFLFYWCCCLLLNSANYAATSPRSMGFPLLCHK